jgi:hypothetical protein
MESLKVSPLEQVDEANHDDDGVRVREAKKGIKVRFIKGRTGGSRRQMFIGDLFTEAEIPNSSMVLSPCVIVVVSMGVWLTE